MITPSKQELEIFYDLIGEKNKIREIVVCDGDHGMVPDMLRIAVAWGGGHRQGSEKVLINMGMVCHQLVWEWPKNTVYSNFSNRMAQYYF